jgi:hypothetical protein
MYRERDGVLMHSVLIAGINFSLGVFQIVEANNQVNAEDIHLPGECKCKPLL